MSGFVPKSLLQLPMPWAQLSANVWEYGEPSANLIATALDVLERVFVGLSQLPRVQHPLPDYVSVAPGLWRGMLAHSMPTFDKFDLSVVTSQCRQQDPQVAEETAINCGVHWLRAQAGRLADRIVTWLAQALAAEPRPGTVGELLEMISRLAEKETDGLNSLLLCLWTLDRDRTRPVAEQLAQLQTSVGETARELLA